MGADVSSSNTSFPVCGTLPHGARGLQRSGLACLGTEFRTKSVVTLATGVWPSFVMDPPSTTTRMSARASSATPCGTPSTTLIDSAPPISTSGTEAPTSTMAPPSVGTRLTGLVLVQGGCGHSLCLVYGLVWLVTGMTILCRFEGRRPYISLRTTR
ncbi:hypothetical protein CSPAE12_10246 [Colletotrichum incanum]|nr:hypothetical protein CSPAE12_10246 [Colletotrichum incanum]